MSHNVLLKTLWDAVSQNLIIVGHCFHIVCDIIFILEPHFSPELCNTGWEKILAKVWTGVEEQVLRVLHHHRVEDDDTDKGDGDIDDANDVTDE